MWLSVEYESSTDSDDASVKFYGQDSDAESVDSEQEDPLK
jgi:hypothetical protein